MRLYRGMNFSLCVGVVYCYVLKFFVYNLLWNVLINYVVKYNELL